MPERRTPGRLLGPADAGAGELPDCAWMIIYPHTHRSDIGKTVVPGPGSFLGNGGLGSVGLYLSSAGKFCPVRLVKLGDIPREVADILGTITSTVLPSLLAFETQTGRQAAPQMRLR